MPTNVYGMTGATLAVLLVIILFRCGEFLRTEAILQEHKTDTSMFRFSGAWICLTLMLLVLVLVGRTVVVTAARVATQRLNDSSATNAEPNDIFYSSPSKSFSK